MVSFIQYSTGLAAPLKEFKCNTRNFEEFKQNPFNDLLRHADLTTETSLCGNCRGDVDRCGYALLAVASIGRFESAHRSRQALNPICLNYSDAERSWLPDGAARSVACRDCCRVVFLGLRDLSHINIYEPTRL